MGVTSSGCWNPRRVAIWVTFSWSSSGARRAKEEALVNEEGILAMEDVVVPWTVSKKGVHCRRSAEVAQERMWMRWAGRERRYSAGRRRVGR